MASLLPDNSRPSKSEPKFEMASAACRKGVEGRPESLMTLPMGRFIGRKPSQTCLGMKSAPKKLSPGFILLPQLPLQLEMLFTISSLGKLQSQTVLWHKLVTQRFYLSSSVLKLLYWTCYVYFSNAFRNPIYFVFHQRIKNRKVGRLILRCRTESWDGNRC